VGELGVEGGWFGFGHTSDALFDDFNYERAVRSGSQAIQRFISHQEIVRAWQT
jgi:hypothetical protein